METVSKLSESMRDNSKEMRQVVNSKLKDSDHSKTNKCKNLLSSKQTLQLTKFNKRILINNNQLSNQTMLSMMEIYESTKAPLNLNY